MTIQGKNYSCLNVYSAESIGFTAWATWLTDKNDKTCNTGSSWSGQFITVTLDTPVPITWIRIVAKNDGKITFAIYT